MFSVAVSSAFKINCLTGLRGCSCQSCIYQRYQVEKEGYPDLLQMMKLCGNFPTSRISKTADLMI